MIHSALDLISSRLTSEGLEVRSPVSGDVVATCASYAPEAVSAAIGEASEAFAPWARRTAKERSARLRRWHELMLENRVSLAIIATLESGKPVSESMAEVDYAASFLDWFAEEAKRAYGDIIPAHAPTKRLLTFRQPVGVCAAITPWNFPLAMITRKAGAALAAGCTMIVKPAEATPLSALALEVLARLADVPPGVFKVTPTTDPAAIGKVFCDSPVIRKLSFTGSTRTGKILLAQCSHSVKRVSMELGGNAPLIVFDDADLEKAVAGTIASKFRNAGQTCVSANRILVQAGIHDRFVDELTSKVAALRRGDSFDEQTQLGPMINKGAADRVARLVEDAVKAGARIVTGGARGDPNSTFFPPTVLTRVRPDMAISQNEIFGPVAPVTMFEREAEALQLANDTLSGLAAYVFTENNSRIWRMSEALEFGMVGINDGLISTELAPFGGVKESGLGREGSRYGLDEYLEIKYVAIGGISNDT